MTIRPHSARSLKEDHWRVWNEIQESNPALDSPYFRAEFTQAVSEVRDNVEVGLLQQRDEIIGCFPFHRRANAVGKPVGHPLSDFHGLVVGPETAWDAADLIRQCGLNAWDYDHLIASQQPFMPFHREVVDSPYIDLSQGFERYWDERMQSEHKKFKQIRASMRRLKREIGPLRLDFDVQDPAILETMMAWKSAQFRRSGIMDVFEIFWIGELLRNLLVMRTDGFSAVLSTLHAGERLVAVTFNLRSRNVMHGWFMSYDRELLAYSPGFILLMELVREAAQQGIKRFDLGKGDEPYKPKIASGNLQVCEGSVDHTYIRRAVRGVVLRAASSVRSSPLREPIADLTRPVRRYLNYIKTR